MGSDTVAVGTREGSERGLGKRRFEIHASRDELAVRVVLCAMALGLTWLLLRWPDSVLDGILYLLAVGLAAASILSTLRRGVEVFEEGMVVRTELGERSVRYDQALRLRFVKMVRTAQGVSAGTTLHIAVTSRSGDRVRFSTTLGQDGGGYDVVRDRIARHIGSGLLTRLQDAGQTEWIRRDGSPASRASR
jgi:hypothetical protein